MIRLSNFLLLSIFFLFTGCNQENVKLVKKSFFKTKLGTVENQKLITQLPKIKKTIIIKVVKKEKRKTNFLIQEKKERFKEILVPIVTEVYNRLQSQYLNVKVDIANEKNQEFIQKLKIEYKVKTDKKLLEALKPHPISITLAQAAIESAWLTSRFTKEANNIFGVWSFRSNEPRIEASSTRDGKKIYLKKYKTYNAAVTDYYKNLGKNWAYARFREQRVLVNNPYYLIKFLGSYSEKRERYIAALKKMIDYNKFYQYDIK